MLEQVINNNGDRKSGLYKHLVQAFDRTYFRLCPNRIRADHKPHTYDFSSLTREEYLEDPELFYKKPDEIPEFLLTKNLMWVTLRFLMSNSQVLFRPYMKKIILHTDISTRIKLRRARSH